MPGRALKLTRAGLASQPGHGLQALATMACGRLLRWHELSRQRQALLGLNERMLKDIGITRAEAEREARRPFWSDGIDRGTAPALPYLERRRPAYERLTLALIRLMLERRQAAAVHGTGPLAAAADGNHNADAERQR